MIFQEYSIPWNDQSPSKLFHSFIQLCTIHSEMGGPELHTVFNMHVNHRAIVGHNVILFNLGNNVKAYFFIIFSKPLLSRFFFMDDTFKYLS